MFERPYVITNQSMLLLGPRGVGKSTFIRQQVRPTLEIDLLKTTNFRELSQNPSTLEERLAHLRPKDTVFIDEIQRIPDLLNEVHRLIESRNLRFVLTGSSARKLRKAGVNLLAGRALSKKMYPLTFHELKKWDLSALLKFGTLPSVFKKDWDPSDYLASYVDTYLKEEIFQEAITRNLDQFLQFLTIVGQHHGQILNYESISREVGKSGDTVKSWFQILKDTLIGYELPAFTPHFFTRETKHNKFYVFDPGVANSLCGDLNDLPSEKRGFLFETLILNELRTYFEVSKRNLQIKYLAIPSMGDIDFIIETKKKSMSSPSQFVSIDLKLSKKWNSNFAELSHKLKEKAGARHQKALAVYLGDERRTQKGLEIYPLRDFVRDLWSGKIL